jgi:hypothetical protein
MYAMPNIPVRITNKPMSNLSGGFGSSIEGLTFETNLSEFRNGLNCITPGDVYLVSYSHFPTIASVQSFC